jgi:hypothetical protein
MQTAQHRSNRLQTLTHWVMYVASITGAGAALGYVARHVAG